MSTLSSSVSIQTGDKEPVTVFILGLDNKPLAGLNDIKIKCRRASDGLYLDWSTNSFTASPTQLLQKLEQVSATNSPGEYHLDTLTHVKGFDTSTITQTVEEEIYTFTSVQDGGTTALNPDQIGEIKVGGFVDDIVEDRYPVIL